MCFQIDGRYWPFEITLLEMVKNVDGVTHLLDYFEDTDVYILVLERPENCMDLFEYITNHGPLPEATARGLFRQIVNTLIDIEKAGVYHCDIKDENILVELDWLRTKIIDFGSGATVSHRPHKHFGGQIPIINFLHFNF